MFRIISTLILLIAFTVQCFHVGGVVLGYYMNTPAFARNCVNKSKPVLKCNGKCQMAKKIQEQQEKDSKSPENNIKNNFQFIGFTSGFITIDSTVQYPTRSYQAYHSPHVPAGALGSVFRPPSLV